MAKTIAWADQSGDVITLTAPAWSGSQTVTLSTPENFGIARELNIVFYSESNPAVSATLNVKQAGATLSLSETSVTFGSDETSEKTITVTTNMSTLSGAKLVLEGSDSSNFTLSELSALSGGKATFTIKPNSANTGQAVRNVTVKLTAGRLATLSLPVTQEADTVVSTTYENYRVESPLLYYEPSGSSKSKVTQSTTITAKGGTISLQGTPKRTKVTTYSSGRVDRVDEEISSGSSLFISLGGWCSDGYWRFKTSKGVSALSITDGSFSVEVDSLGITLRSEGDLTISCELSDKPISSDPTSEVIQCFAEENKRESYSSFTSTSIQDKSVSAESQLVTLSGHTYGNCLYTSGEFQKENVPLLFEESSDWISITSQTPGTPGLSLVDSYAEIQVNQNTSEVSRESTINVYPRLADGSKGGDLIKTATLSQAAAAPKYGTLTVTTSSPYGYNADLSFFYGSISEQNQLGISYSVQSIKTSEEVPAGFMSKVLDEYSGSPRADNVIVAYMSGGDPFGTPIKKGQLSPAEMNELLVGSNKTVNVE